MKGKVIYRDNVVDIPSDAIDPRFIERMGGQIRRVADEKPAFLVPSSSECALCPIPWRTARGESRHQRKRLRWINFERPLSTQDAV